MPVFVRKNKMGQGDRQTNYCGGIGGEDAFFRAPNNVRLQRRGCRLLVAGYGSVPAFS